jgi:hypothetical protein
MFKKQKMELQVRSEPIQIQVFQTSIWDETLYAVMYNKLLYNCRCTNTIENRLGLKSSTA